MSTLISHVDCKHPVTLFVQSARHVSDQGGGTENVSVCAVCGEFHVWGWANGEHFDVRFALPTDRQAQAAGLYAAYLRERGE